jgi:hypothetical protein
MISRYSRTGASALSPSRASMAATQAPIVASGIVDLVHHAGGELAHRGQLFALENAQLHLADIGDVLADGDDVGDRLARRAASGSG